MQPALRGAWLKQTLSTDSLEEKFTGWIRELDPHIPNAMIARRMDHLLAKAFRSNLKIILMIDEPGQEQQHTIRNVIEAFKLESGESVQFIAYVIRLGQKISVVDQDAEYSLDGRAVVSTIRDRKRQPNFPVDVGRR